MSAPFIVPFNFQPVSSAKGTTATYTVPAGKYTLLTVHFDFSFNTSGATIGSGGTTAVVGGWQTQGALSGSFNIWMKAGETLALAASNTTGTATYGAHEWRNISAIAGFSTTINGSLWKNTQSRCSALLIAAFNSLSYSVSITPTSNFGWYAQEYNVIS